MPHRGRLVTFLTTCFAAPLTVLAVPAFQATGVAEETARQAALQASFGGSVTPAGRRVALVGEGRKTVADTLVRTCPVRG
jgi:hypothetical protein